MPKRLLSLAAASAATAAIALSGAHAADLPVTATTPLPVFAAAQWSPWMVRVRLLGVLPDPGAKLTAGGAPLSGANVSITDAAIPELDISYFITKNIAAELILGVTRHSINGAGTLAGTKIGSTWLLPPTLTVQYHFTDLGAFKPYVGVGATYAVFFGERERGPFNSFRLTDSIGPTVQVGFDYMLNEHWGLNVDLKKSFFDTKVKLNAGLVRGRVDIDPWIVGAGVTYKF